MTSKEAFKLGFLQKCAADRLSTDEILERIKHAKFMLDGQEKMADGILDTLKGIGGWGVTAGLVAPPLAGALGGAVMSDATSHKYDVEEAKKREELAELQRATKAMQALKQRQQPLMA